MFDVACGGAEVLKIIKFVWTLLDMVLFIVPMGLIVMIILDLAKNVIAGRDDAMKKNFGIAVKRILFCVALIFVPIIVKFAIKMVSGETEKESKNKGAFQCINIAITEDDFSKYEVEFSE